ncbi:MAG: N-6 DNA methylase [Roseiflexus sp.]|nr:N-6 DNA methylase [Roseiflexus sp.]MCS7288963.1 N-6 DNA methylase [Roseiflexus sp.]MDW8144962.1 N-6 DNA methylase [Roseiflexaceae bacterium]MDW8233933.1 N-6 DNA methylase [Roseiflexaceae bacterium]
MPVTSRSPSSALRIEGGLFGPDLIEALASGDLPGQRPSDFGLPPGAALTDEIALAFNQACAYWDAFQQRLARLPLDDPALRVTRDGWVVPFLSLLGYEPTPDPQPHDIGGMTFPISHRVDGRADAPPLHIVGARQDLGRVPERARPRLSPHALLQEYLNRSDALWGVTTNGLTLRLLRNSTYIRRQVYAEFDLRAIFAEQRFADFTLLFRLLHRSRLPQSAADAHTCILEQYYQRAIEQGGRVRDRLRDGVEQCLTILANGLLTHPQSAALRDHVRREGAHDCYRQLLRLVYRFLFLLTAEARGLMEGAGADGAGQYSGGRDVYRDHYGVGRLCRLSADRRARDDHDDLWLGLRALWHTLRDERLAALLGVPPLNGELFEPLPLDAACIHNRNLLAAFWHLAWYHEDDRSPPRRVNYAALDTEELGSVYESLLELHPVLEEGRSPALWRFTLTTSSAERRSTGSHYTPPDLVAPLIRHALEPVMQERLAACRTPAAKEAALLNLRVLDPACGSGHFLLAAARRLGRELARIRTGEDEPAPEHVRQGIRDAITHCIYGVDKNPLAVELCRVALWLEGHGPNQPLTFLDHRIRHGDSLVGVRDLSVLEAGVPDDAYKPTGSDDRAAARQAKARNARERDANLFRHSFVTQPLAAFADAMRAIAAMPEATIEQVRVKRAAYAKAYRSADVQRLIQACDAFTAAFFLPPRAEGSQVRAITTAAVQDALTRGNLPDARLGASVLEVRTQHAFFHWALEFADVFAQGGFDVIIGNPPFMGGLRISGAYGEDYRRWLEYACQPFGGTADLCAAFIRRAYALLRPGGRLGMIATNTLGQGDTRESGLAVIIAQGGRITFAQRFVRWPGQASVEVNLVAIHKPSPATENANAPPPAPLVEVKDKGSKGAPPPAPPVAGGKEGEGALTPPPSPLAGAGGQESKSVPPPAPTGGAGGRGGEGSQTPPLLDGHPVPFISSRLDDMPERDPQRLRLNEGKAFIGDFVRGLGFVLEPAEAERLLAADPSYADCLFPYLNGEDLNSHPEQQPSRWVICFHDWSLERARQYPDLLRIVEERVKPERERLKGPSDSRDRQRWWLFARYREDMRPAIAPLRRVLARAEVSQMHAITFVPKNQIYSHMLIIFAFDDDYHFALLQSAVHEAWTRKQASSLRTDLRYTPTDCFDTFPFPAAEYAALTAAAESASPLADALAALLAQPVFAQAAQIGAECHEHRRQVMLARRLGLTKTYTLVHDPACRDADIVHLRELHAAMDRAILACYGWDDLALQHDFYPNDRGQTRFMPSAAARRAIIARLMELNAAVGSEA